MSRIASRILTCGAVVVVVLLLSQLSVGPMAWLHGRGMITERTAGLMEETLYLPLNLAAQYSPVCENVTRRYVAIWEPTNRVPASPGPYSDLQ